MLKLIKEGLDIKNLLLLDIGSLEDLECRAEVVGGGAGLCCTAGTCSFATCFLLFRILRGVNGRRE